MKTPPFIMLQHAVYDSPEFGALAPIDIAVLLLLLRKHNGHNNGDIALGVREVAARCRCGYATVLRAFNALQASGLIALISKGHLVPELGRPNVASRWRITFLDKKDDPHERDRASEMEHRGVSGMEQRADPALFRYRNNSPRSATETVYRQSYQGKAEQGVAVAAGSAPPRADRREHRRLAAGKPNGRALP
jgi:hypothetical protein